ncbi:mediator complex subunit Med5-domain-containing protein [Lanmaoa asiatica]|nr:mediator complex subunit Med5-domain-containing protein [Lanmaoa asiatica]
MFSQFRQAVESLAQPLPPQSQDNALSADIRSQSPDPLRQPSAQLAENALANLRKSIAAQRTTSPTPQNTGNPRSRSASPGPSSSAKSTSDSGLRKTTLEERLRASFVVFESSGGSSPNPSTRASPTPHTVPVTQHPLSPTPTPVPDSPSPAIGTTVSVLDTPVDDSVQTKECKDTNDALTPSQEPNDAAQPPSITPPTDPQDPASSIVGSTDSIHTDSTADPSVGATLTQETSQAANTEPQPHTQQYSQVSEVVDALTVDTDPPEEECIKVEPEPTITDESKDAGIDVLQERLKLVEQRFADVSTSFKELQVDRRDIDSVISELTPLKGSKDVAALREYLISVNMKVELSQDELQRLNGKLTRQEERLEELRDTHRLETASQSDQIEKLRRQLTEAEALVTASQSTASQTEEDNAKRNSDLERLRAEVSKASEIAKEEEEKRVKAISLLKTVRQKLVKAEKERDDTLRELNETRERNLEEKEEDRAERASLERDVNAANAEREKAVNGLRAQFDKDIVAARDRAERDIQTAKKQFDVETNALKVTHCAPYQLLLLIASQTSHSAEISAKKSRIGTLENTVAKLTSENKSFFEQLELRQAELESSQCHSGSLQAQNTEFQFQLKELQERITLLNDEIGELRGEHEMRSQIPGASTEEISQLVSSIEIKYEGKLSELKRTLTTAEKERTEAEANWSRKLAEKTKETEELKRMLQSTVQLRERDEDVTGTLKAEIEKLQSEARSQYGLLYELQTHIDAFKDAESNLHRRLSEATSRADDGEKQLEESKSREAQLRTQNKTLRDELRKVQNSAAVLERQRNPGAGYWTSRPEVAGSRTSISSIPDAPSSSSLPLVKNEEEINYEYLRNVILQFLEHKEMRSGISPAQWLELCKLWVDKETLGDGSVNVGPAISDAVIALCSIYDANPILLGYLRHALSCGLVSTSDFVAAFLRAARSSQLQSGSTLDVLCRIALDFHYASGLPPLGSLIPSASSQTPKLTIVNDALSFLRQAYSLPPSSFHTLSTSASELITLVLPCIPDVLQMSTTQAMICFGDANDLLHSVRLSQGVRQVLETFVFSLSLLIGDDAKAAREAQIIHTQLALGKSDMLGSNLEADSISCGLLLQSFIASRASDYGAGSGLEAVVLLTGLLRWTSLAPNVFYTQMLLASMTCVAQSSPKGIHDGSFFIWRTFILGRVRCPVMPITAAILSSSLQLPRLLHMFEKELEGHGTVEADWRAAMHVAVSAVLQRSDLLSRCDHVQAQARARESSAEETAALSSSSEIWPFTYSCFSPGSFVRELIQQLYTVRLIDQAFAVTADPTLANDSGTRLQAEALEHNCTLESYLESRLTMELSEEDTRTLLHRIRLEPGSHHFFAQVVRKRFTSHSKSGDLEVLSHLTKMLYAHDFALDILSLHLKITDLVFEALELLHEYDCETIGDPQTAVSHLGDVVLFIQMVLTKFQISAPSLRRGSKVLRTDFLRSSRVYHTEDLPPDVKTVFTGWFKAIFDSSSEGIDDTILRLTKLKTLLQMCPTLFSQACIARQEGRIDNDVLHNGISYFLGPLLNWTLVGVVHAMLFEVQQRGFAAPFQLEVLQSLLLASTCPHVILRLCSPNILKILSGKRTQMVISSLHYDIGAIRSVAFRTLSVKKEGNSQTAEDPATTSPDAFLDFPRREIRDAFALARQHKAPRIDVGRCLTITTPTKFLLLLWSELCVAASLGETETCRRIMTFVLVVPRSGVPPLLPLFMYNVLPQLIAAVDQQGSDTSVRTELLATIIAGALSSALHLEWALQTMCNEHTTRLGQASAVLGRRLAADLRTRKANSSTSKTILERLSTSSPFAANFPVFMT